MEKIYDSCLKIIECTQSLKLLRTNIEEMETHAGCDTGGDFRGLANLIDLVANKIEEAAFILDSCDSANK